MHASLSHVSPQHFVKLLAPLRIYTSVLTVAVCAWEQSVLPEITTHSLRPGLESGTFFVRLRISTNLKLTSVLYFLRLRCRFLASNSQLSSHYSDLAEGKPVTLSMAIDSIQSLQRQLNDVEKKVCALWTSAYKKRCLLEIPASLRTQTYFGLSLGSAEK